MIKFIRGFFIAAIGKLLPVGKSISFCSLLLGLTLAFEHHQCYPQKRR